MTNAQLKSSRLRIYRGPEETASRTTVESSPSNNGPTVTTTAGELLPLLADAIASERTWLRDFEDDEITVSSDLHDVLMAYQFFRRPSA